ncbi:hypothetical protein TB2_016575 [Malus domestica]
MASEHGGSAFANIPQVPEATIPVTPYGNHLNFFNAAGLAMKTYRHYDPRTHGLDFEGMLEDLCSGPTGAIVLLQACAHNPTGLGPKAGPHLVDAIHAAVTTHL